MTPLDLLGLRRSRARLWQGLPREGRGLEIGAGSGIDADLRSVTGTLVRTDISTAMLQRARAREPELSRLAAADVQALPFRDASFDWAVASLVFCEVPDPLRGLRELHRALRPGGTLHLLEHVRPHGALLGGAARMLTRLTGPLLGEHFDRVTQDSVLAAGFTIERADSWLRGGLVHLVARREPGGVP